jgi:hypothetical protein
LLYFSTGQATCFPGCQVSESQRPQGDPPQVQHFVPDAGQDAANLSVTSFGQYDLEFRTARMPSPRAKFRHTCHTLGQVHPFTQLLQRLGRWKTEHRRAVGFGNPVAGMRQQVGQIAIVSHENEPFTRAV